MNKMILDLGSSEATEALGAAVGRWIQPGDIIYLKGDLGAGKTTLARGLMQALGHAGPVKSPTYTLIETYELPVLPVAHLDLYRLKDPEELAYIGLREFLNGQGLVLVEWPEHGTGELPKANLEVVLEYRGSGGRIAQLTGQRPLDGIALE